MNPWPASTTPRAVADDAASPRHRRRGPVAVSDTQAVAADAAGPAAVL
ncbi:MAG: hypothetical protein KF850_09120 [Labilithrix sp.]|nr:hypothetical protein [Labilithrix sp.]